MTYMKKISKQQEKELLAKHKQPAKVKPKKDINLNYVAIIILVLFGLAEMILSKTLLKNSSINLLAIFSLVLVTTIFVISWILSGRKKRRDFLIPKGIGVGCSLNPRNKYGFVIYLILFIVSVAECFS